MTDFTHTQQQLAAELIPYGVGSVMANAVAELDFVKPPRLFKYPEAMIAALETDGVPDVVGFSNYVWNSSLSSDFAKRLKQLRPDVITVFGGPNYPTHSADRQKYLSNHPEIDFYVVFEGEVVFAQLLRVLANANRNPDAVHGMVQSVHSLDANGAFHETDIAARSADLAKFPSPYLNGMLDEFFDGRLLPIVQFNRGCPFKCTFCCEGEDYFNKVRSHGLNKLNDELHYIAKRMANARTSGGRNDLGIADSNFGMFKDDIEFARILASLQDEHSWPDYIHVATGKNQKHRVLNVARTLRGAMRLSGSVQTLDPTALENIKRSNISPDDLLTLAMDASDIQANSYTETILGLPGETKEAHYTTLRTLMEAEFNRVICYQLMLLPGTDLNTTETREKYEMEVRYRVLPRCFGAYPLHGDPIVSAEIEEICIANSTLSFEDYLEARRLHLMISIFYNDGVFSGLLKFLKSVGASIFRWMELLRDADYQGRTVDLMTEFENATRNELWQDRAALEEFVRSEGVMEKYVAGELGINLMLTFKSMGMTEYVGELTTLARETAAALLAEEGADSQENLNFLSEILTFDAARMSRIWFDQDRPVEEIFRFDIPGFYADTSNTEIGAFRLPEPTAYRFVLNAEQRRIVKQYVSLFGNDRMGVSRILSKSPTRRLLRNPEPVA